MTTIIKKGELLHLEELSKLFDEYRVFYGKDSDSNAAKEFLHERIIKQESEIFVAINNQQLVGFVQLYPIFSSTQMKRLWLLNDLFVCQRFRGKGISLQLIETAKHLCKTTKACSLILETAKTNEIGNNLYPKAGFSLDIDYNYYSWQIDTVTH
jgi:GNAT superfamily N-acetyltransferase